MKKLVFTVVLPLAIAGCAQSTPLEEVTNPAVANPAAGVSLLQPMQFITNFEQRIATDPAPWRSLNDAQSSEEEEN